MRRCFNHTSRSEEAVNVVDGFIDGNHQVMGTYIHGVFDNDEFRLLYINQLRERKGLGTIRCSIPLFRTQECNIID